MTLIFILLKVKVNISQLKFVVFIMAIEKTEFENIIKENFPGAKFILNDMVGDGDHYSLEISSPEFEGLSPLKAHRLINEKLKNYIGTTVHALTISSINLI